MILYVVFIINVIFYDLDGCIKIIEKIFLKCKILVYGVEKLDNLISF